MIETTHLAPDSRKHDRVRTSDREGALVVEWGSQLLDVVDWSVEGMRVATLPEELRAAGEGTVRVAVSVEETWVSFAARVRVVRPSGQEGARPADTAAALAFVDLSRSGAEILHAIAAAALAGEPPRLATVLERVEPEDVSIRASGATPLATLAPVGPAAPTPAPKKPGTGTAAAGPWRPPLRVGVYVVIGALLAAYLANSLYERVWRIEVDAASLVAPTARLASPADGLLRELRVAPGDRVLAGASVFLVESPSVQAALDRAILEAGQAEARVKELEALRDAQLERLAIHRRVMKARVGAKATQVTLLEERLGLTDVRVRHLAGLVGEAVSPFELDAARAERAAIAGELSAARGALTTEAGGLGAARAGYYFDGDRIEEGLPETEAALVAAEAELALRRALLGGVSARASIALSGRAPFAGRVAEVLQTDGTPVRQGNLVVVLEADDAVRVEAWVTRHEAEYVRIGAPARVSVAGVGRTFEAIVRSVDADPGASAVLAEAGEGPRLQVLLDLVGYAGEPGSEAAARADLREVDAVGLPVVVSFARSWR